MNIEDRIARLEAAVFPQDTPAPHPLAGLEFTHISGGYWVDTTRHDDWGDCYSSNWKFRDCITHAPVPLWQVAKRLGVEHPVPPEVRWTDVEYEIVNRESWTTVARTKKHIWHGLLDDYDDYRFRLTAQYDHQPITYEQFREILAREDKPASEVECKAKPFEFRVGDLVEVVMDWGRWHKGERLYIVGFDRDGDILTGRDEFISRDRVALVPRYT